MARARTTPATATPATTDPLADDLRQLGDLLAGSEPRDRRLRLAVVDSSNGSITMRDSDTSYAGPYATVEGVNIVLYDSDDGGATRTDWAAFDARDLLTALLPLFRQALTGR